MASLFNKFKVLISKNNKQNINNFEIINKIDEGAFGVVFKVKNKLTNDLFAIKRIQIKENPSETLKEIKIMSQLKSEFVVNYHNSWTEAMVMFNNIENFVFIQMELCEQNLESIIETINELNEQKFKTIKYFIRSELLIEIIECINYLHSRNPPIIHRDLKPQNILITDGIDKRFIKLCDFGLSKSYEESQNTRDVGTHGYIAPEVRDYTNYNPNTDRSHYNLKSDIYSLGVIAKQLFDVFESSDLFLNEKFSKLYKEISIMLSEDPMNRPNCSELLDKTHEWTVDSNIVKSDKNYKEFIEFTENDENLKILKEFIEYKNALKSKVKFYHQMGKYIHFNYSSFFVMNDNKVYSIGYNGGGILGLGHERRVNEFTLIEELCDQNIQEFFEGNYCMFGRNNKNLIFSWGHNWSGMLARGYSSGDDEYLKPMKIEFFENKNIIQISCGLYHSLGLTEEGLIYGWGFNYFGQTGSRSNNIEELIPIRVELSDSSDRIKFIHCLKNTSCAVTVDGRAFIWGEINGRKTVIPILIETDCTKTYLVDNEYCSLLKENKFIFMENKRSKTLIEKTVEGSEQLIDIFGLKTVLIKDAVYEVKQNKKIEKTNYSNFYEYFWNEERKIKETIQITSDGYLKRPIIQLNMNSNEILLKKIYKNISEKKLLDKTFVNIFDLKYDYSFEKLEIFTKFLEFNLK